jgi:SP family general alpha glucoside:H+ symporter-like MFS transporter
MSSSTSSGRAQSSADNRFNGDEKPHPSEFLEFVTIPPTHQFEIQEPSHQHREDASLHKSIGSTALHPTTSADDLFEGLNSTVPGFATLSADAKKATKAEHKMTFWQGVRLYPKAIGWSVLLSFTIVMEGYDTTLINSFYAFPVFRKSYGTQIENQDYQISASWQSGLTNGAVAGEIIGLLFNGYLTDRYGYQKTMIGALIWLCLFVFLAFFSFNVEMLLASEIMCGLSWGIFQTLSTTYAAEVMPTVLRSYLTSNVNMCWLVGQITSVGIVRALVNNSSEGAYRIPFGLQWAFAVPILVGVTLAPESPWWLIRHERYDEAKKSLLRLTSLGQDFNVDETVSMMRQTNEVEKYLKEGTTYFDCFRGIDRRRTEIACMVWITQSLCGSPMTGYAAYFYEQAGFKPERAFDLSLGMYGLAIIGGMLSWWWMRWIGRRTLYIWGLAASFVVLIVAGSVGTMNDSVVASWTLGSLIIFLTFVYDSTIGPICYTLVAEIPSTRLRVKTVVIARITYNIAGLCTNVLMPRMLNPTAWNWKGKTCFFWAGTTLIMLAWAYFRLPEPKGLTYLEMDILFQKRAKARKFRELQVNLASTGYFSLQEQRPETWRGYG